MFASVVYQLAGKEAVFLVLAALAVLLALIQITVRTLKVERRPPVCKPALDLKKGKLN